MTQGFHPDADAGTAHSAKVAGELFEERVRQQIAEPYPAHRDDGYTDGELAKAAAAYAVLAGVGQDGRPAVAQSALKLARTLWPWPLDTFRPKDRRRDLVRAGALILAEIERMDRAAETPAVRPPMSEGER